MERSVTLDRLPDGLTVPLEMEPSFRYDPSSRRLSFQGFMSKAEFDRLGRLHEDWGYRRALEELFRLCAIEPKPRPVNRLSSVFDRLIPGRDRVEG